MKTRNFLPGIASALVGILASPLASASVEQPPPSQVPEPESLVLFAIGVTAIAVARRLRR